jgi:hypothetical protein
VVTALTTAIAGASSLLLVRARARALSAGQHVTEQAPAPSRKLGAWQDPSELAALPILPRSPYGGSAPRSGSPHLQ